MFIDKEGERATDKKDSLVPITENLFLVREVVCNDAHRQLISGPREESKIHLVDVAPPGAHRDTISEKSYLLLRILDDPRRVK